jgi:CDP-6-deoxy-D-xylo-4-hexulose-3-dehydrase
MADRIHHSGFFLPNHPALTDDDVARIAQIVREAA